MAKRAPNIIQCIDDPALFARSFKGESWAAWRVFLKALFGLLLTRAERADFIRHTGRATPPAEQAREAWLVVGRRGGKSFIVALIAVYLACFRDYKPHLAPGERGVLMVLAADRKQARVIFRYVRALLRGVPLLARLIVAERAEAIELRNGIDIEITTSSFRAVRGYTIIGALLDEVAFWRDEDSANPDSEIVAALRPAMATVPGALLIGISSPYARRGVLWERYRDHYGKAGDVLVWQAPSRDMNPTIPQSVVDRAFADDPASAGAEYGAQFRGDVSGFLLPEWIDGAVDEGVTERPPVPGTRYAAFIDPSGGASDSFTLGIAHFADGRRVLDVCRGRVPPFEPQTVVGEFAAILARYGCFSAAGDRYAGQWVAEAFLKAGIMYTPAEKTKSELYLETEPLFAQGAARLLDVRRLLTELRQLERRTGAARDRVDHPPRAHDDFANAACGALHLARPHAAIDYATQAAVADPGEQRAALDTHVAALEFDAVRGSKPWDMPGGGTPWD